MSDLHELVYNNDTEKIINFLNNHENPKAVINSYNEFGKTPLHIAVKNNNQEIATILVNNGANTKLPDNKGQSIIWIGQQKGGNQKKTIKGRRYIN